MDAVKFIKEKNRMCKSNPKCSSCPVSGENNSHNLPCDNLMNEKPAIYVRAVEKWSKKHPEKTRQSEFLKIFPNAKLTGFGSLKICPKDVDQNIECLEGGNCLICRKKYWLEEVE